MQGVILVVQVEGNLLKSGYLGANSIIVVIGLLFLVCRFSGSELVTKQKSSSRVFLARREYAIVTPPCSL